MFTKIFSSQEIEAAAACLLAGELVAFPTETVYGLGAPIFFEPSIAKIFQVKNRPSDNPLIAHIADIQDVEKIAQELPSLFFSCVEHFFPGPLTLIVKKAPRVPAAVSGGRDTIALRMPDHKVALALIKEVGMPLVAPSANLSGKPSSTAVAHILEDFEGKIAGVIDGGPSPIGIESTVISLLDPKKPLLLRPGHLSSALLEEKLRVKIAQPDSLLPTLSPGVKYRHYAPKAKVILIYSLEALDLYLKKNKKVERRIFVPNSHNLYATFRQADKELCAEIILLMNGVQDPALINRISKTQ